MIDGGDGGYDEDMLLAQAISASMEETVKQPRMETKEEIRAKRLAALDRRANN